MMGEIFITGHRNLKGHPEWIDTTASAKSDWQSELSPFRLGPCKLYDGYVSRTMENGWQYAKVYEGFTDKDGDPNKGYWDWAESGWTNPRAVRYPMGKGSRPLYSYWNGERLGYIEARKRIYCPLYARAVEKTAGYKRLKELYKKQGFLQLFDFDGYNHRAINKSYRQVLNDPTRIMGHAFVLAMMLDDKREWER